FPRVEALFQVRRQRLLANASVPPFLRLRDFLGGQARSIGGQDLGELGAGALTLCGAPIPVRGVSGPVLGQLDDQFTRCRFVPAIAGDGAPAVVVVAGAKSPQL